MKETVIWGAVLLSSYLQVPKFDFLRESLPEFITWGESLSGFMTNLYSAIGILFVLAAFISKLLSIKAGYLANESTQLDIDMKKKELDETP